MIGCDLLDQLVKLLKLDPYVYVPEMPTGTDHGCDECRRNCNSNAIVMRYKLSNRIIMNPMMCAMEKR